MWVVTWRHVGRGVRHELSLIFFALLGVACHIKRIFDMAARTFVHGYFSLVFALDMLGHVRKVMLGQ